MVSDSPAGDGKTANLFLQCTDSVTSTRCKWASVAITNGLSTAAPSVAQIQNHIFFLLLGRVRLMPENWTSNLNQFFNDIAGQRTVFDSSHEANEKKHNQSPKLKKSPETFISTHKFHARASFLACVQLYFYSTLRQHI